MIENKEIEVMKERGLRKVQRKSNFVRYYAYMLESEQFLGKEKNGYFLTEEPMQTFSYSQVVAIMFPKEYSTHYLQRFTWLLIEA